MLIHLADVARQILRSRILVRCVDPIPREVADCNRWQARRVCSGKCERRNVSNHNMRTGLTEVCRLRRGERRQFALKYQRVLKTRLDIDGQAVDLPHPCVARQRDELAAALEGACEQPEWRRCLDDDMRVGTRAKHRVNDLDGAGRVSETVA